MSEREDIQNRLINYLTDKGCFNAPYGIIDGMLKIGKGKIRNVTFGISRYLDAEIQIWNPKKIVLRGQGGIASNWEIEWGMTFESADELIEFLNEKTENYEN